MPGVGGGSHEGQRELGDDAGETSLLAHTHFVQRVCVTPGGGVIHYDGAKGDVVYPIFVNEAAYSCATDVDSNPREGFWTAEWAKPPEPPKAVVNEILIPAPKGDSP